MGAGHFCSRGQATHPRPLVSTCPVHDQGTWLPHWPRCLNLVGSFRRSAWLVGPRLTQGGDEQAEWMEGSPQVAGWPSAQGLHGGGHIWTGPHSPAQEPVLSLGRRQTQGSMWAWPWQGGAQRTPRTPSPSRPHRGGVRPAAAWAPGLHGAAGEAGFPRQGPHTPFLNKRHSSASNKNAAEWMRPVPLHTVPGGRAGHPRSEQPAQIPGPRCGRSHPNLLGQRKARVLPHRQPSPNPCLVSSTSDHGRAPGSPPSPAPGSLCLLSCWGGPGHQQSGSPTLQTPSVSLMG